MRLRCYIPWSFVAGLDTFRTQCFISGDFKLLQSDLDSLQSEFAAKPVLNCNSVDKAESAKALRTENGRCKFNSRDPNLDCT